MGTMSVGDCALSPPRISCGTTIKTNQAAMMAMIQRCVM
jgi:hypothetical protein